MRLFLGDQSVVITKDFIFVLEEADECVRGCFEFVCELLFEVRPRRAGGLAVCTGLDSPRDCGVAALRSDPLGSSIVEILRVSKAGM